MLPDPRIWTCGSRKRSSRCARQRSVTDWASPDFRPDRSTARAGPGPASTVPARGWYSAPGRGRARGAAASGASASASAFAAWVSCAAARACAWARDPGCASESGSSVQTCDVASWLKSLLIREKTVTGFVGTLQKLHAHVGARYRYGICSGAWVVVGGRLLVFGCWLFVVGRGRSFDGGMEDERWRMEGGGWRGACVVCGTSRGGTTGGSTSGGRRFSGLSL
jgi:hypothetical protein